jgi:hypothetical protein
VMVSAKRRRIIFFTMFAKKSVSVG